MGCLAAVSAGDGLDVLGPLPAGLEGGSPDWSTVELDQLELARVFFEGPPIASSWSAVGHPVSFGTIARSMRTLSTSSAFGSPRSTCEPDSITRSSRRRSREPASHRSTLPTSRSYDYTQSSLRCDLLAACEVRRLRSALGPPRSLVISATPRREGVSQNQARGSAGGRAGTQRASRVESFHPHSSHGVDRSRHGAREHHSCSAEPGW